MTPPGWILTGIPFKPEKGPKMTPLAWGPYPGPQGPFRPENLGFGPYLGHIWAPGALYRVYRPFIEDLGLYTGYRAHIRVPGPISGYIGHLSRIWAYIPGIGPYTGYIGHLSRK